MQSPSLRRRDQRSMRNRKQILGYKPNRLVGSHPIEMIEALHMNGPRKRPQRPVPAEIEVHIEITQSQFAQRPVNRLAIPASRVIRLRDRAPAPINLIYGEHVIGIMFRLKINNQRRIPIHPQSRRRKQRALVAMRSVFRQNPPRRPCRIRQVIGHGIECSLNAVRSLERAQLAQFSGSKAGRSFVRHPNFLVETRRAASCADGRIN